MPTILDAGCNSAPSIGLVSRTDRSAASDLEDALATVLAPLLGVVRISELRRMPGGASRETWAFEASSGEGEGGEEGEGGKEGRDGRSDQEQRSLVLRRDPPGAPSSGLALETELLTAAQHAGVPVPRPVLTGPAGGPLTSAFVVVEHVEGETIPRRILRRVQEQGTGDALAEQCGTILAALHSIPPASVRGLPGGDALEQLRGILDHLGEPHPVLELGLRQLGSMRPPRSAEVVVHGDFRNGNLIVGDDGIRAVLDWELAHRGDPLEDLGWLCARAWRFGSPQPVGGFGTLEALLGAYEKESGTPVDRQALRWWEATAALRWGVICMVQAHTHLSGAARSVELAAIGRRTCEAEWDLLGLVEELDTEAAGEPTDGPAEVAVSAGPDAPTERTAIEVPHDRPTAPELLDAVEEFLRGEVFAASEGRVAFHVRVAANVVALVARQLALGPAQARSHRERLRRLGVRDDAELAASIRGGVFDGRFPEVRRALRDAVADKLAVANPGYAANSETT
jgi:aminoglycoside phosphotransferase (APT) family kinase protein